MTRGRQSSFGIWLAVLYVGVLFLHSARAAEPVDATRAAAFSPLWMVPLETLVNTTQRPLFDPTRRPPPVVPATFAAQPQSTADANSSWALIGLVQGGKAGGLAILRDEQDQSLHRVRLGERYQSWQLVSVQKGQATFQLAQARKVLTMKRNETSANSTAPVASNGRARQRRR